jgi:hypothetical protein
LRTGKWLIVPVAVCFFLSLGFGLVFGLDCIPCEELSKPGPFDPGPNVKITKAELVPPSGAIPEHCLVEGLRHFDSFVVKLPTKWNGSYYQIGNGGAAGRFEDLSLGLSQGYASASGSGGHTQPYPMFAFAYPPGDSDARQKLNDYCYGSVHETSALAKAIVQAFYGLKPRFSYYDGCSTGGRQGLIEAQRYPGDFDGLLIGAPVHDLTRITQRGIWQAQAQVGPGELPLSKLALLAGAVMAGCDGLDGLVDGLIDDPRKCNFDAMTDLPACPGDKDGKDCFTLAQRETIRRIYEGPSGAAATFGEAFGSEAFRRLPTSLGGGFQSGWAGWIVPSHSAESLGLALGAGFLQWAGLPPSGGGGPGWDWRQYDFHGADPQRVMENLSGKCDAVNPDLMEFRKMGGKIIHYSGWADPATGPYQSVDYFHRVLEFLGERKVNEFYKLYMIPGLGHCGGGLGCFDKVALFEALVDWVENGIEPTAYTGYRADRAVSRPMCPYPTVSRYLGDGSIDQAENFICVRSIPVKVRVERGGLKPGKNGKWTALLILPEDLDPAGWRKIAVVGGGASGRFVEDLPKASSHNGGKGKRFIAEFDTLGLIGISSAEEVDLTVTAIFEDREHGIIALEGSDRAGAIQ